MNTIRLSKSELGRPINIRIKIGDTTCVIIDIPTPPTLYFLEFADTLFRLKSSVFLPEGQSPADSGSTESRIVGPALTATCLKQLKNNPSQVFLITGHTDTSGSEGYNGPLSENRSGAVFACICGDRNLFKAMSDAPHISDKKERDETLFKDKIQICNWAETEFGWPTSYASNAFDFLRTFKAFQRSYNEDTSGLNNGNSIDVDGDWGQETWGAVFDCYEFSLAKALGIEKEQLNSLREEINLIGRYARPDGGHVGCNEYYPIDQAYRDNYRSQANRRVEVLFFEKDSIPSFVCHPGTDTCKPESCPAFGVNAPIRLPVTDLVIPVSPGRLLLEIGDDIKLPDDTEFVLEGDPSPFRFMMRNCFDARYGVYRLILGPFTEGTLYKGSFNYSGKTLIQFENEELYRRVNGATDLPPLALNLDLDDTQYNKEPEDVVIDEDVPDSETSDWPVHDEQIAGEFLPDLSGAIATSYDDYEANTAGDN